MHACISASWADKPSSHCFNQAADRFGIERLKRMVGPLLLFLHQTSLDWALASQTNVHNPIDEQSNAV